MLELNHQRKKLINSVLFDRADAAAALRLKRYFSMDDIFRLTSFEYARMLGISQEALRSRRRRNQEDGNFKKVGKVFWWKSPVKDRPQQVLQPLNDRGSRALKHATRSRRRGVMLNGEDTNYHNARNGWQLEEHNRIKALAKIRDKLGDEVVDEITPELFDMAKKRVAEKKEKKLKKEYEKAAAATDATVIYGVDNTPTRYGTKLNEIGLARHEANLHERLNRKWLNETNVKFHNEPGKRHLPDFGSHDTSFRYFKNPYGIGEPANDGSVSFEEWELPRDTSPPKFKNKIEEEIYRLKNKK